MKHTDIKRTVSCSLQFPIDQALKTMIVIDYGVTETVAANGHLPSVNDRHRLILVVYTRRVLITGGGGGGEREGGKKREMGETLV